MHELGELRDRNFRTIKAYLESRDVLVIGYGGWEDSLMPALSACEGTHRIFRCNVFPAENLEGHLGPEVLKILTARSGRAFYVPLGALGANGLMAGLSRALDPEGGLPRMLRDPLKAFRARLGRMDLENLTLTARSEAASGSGVFPRPTLEASAAAVHRLGTDSWGSDAASAERGPGGGIGRPGE